MCSTRNFDKTGHQEIDSQHLELEQLIWRLKTICETPSKSAQACIECPIENRTPCIKRLEKLLDDLLGFVAMHFSYEENLMRQLPPTCRQHVEEHKLSHAEVSNQLKEVILKLDHEHPNQGALRLQSIISFWMDTHLGEFDVHLVNNLESIHDTELAYDVRLAALLKQQPTG